MDGDLILIKLVRNRPILWNRNVMMRSSDRDKMQENAWSQVSVKIGTDSDWIKSRWKTLHDCFLNAYHSNNEQTRSKFRYYNEMVFAVPPPKSMHQMKSDRMNSLPEFIITTKELEESMDDNENIFEEIHSDSDETEQKGDRGDDHDTMPSLMTEECDSNESTANKRRLEPLESHALNSYERQNEAAPVDIPQIKKVKRERMSQDEPTLVNIKSEPITISDPIISQQSVISGESVKTVDNTSTESSQTAVVPVSERCEDTIFGELVTAMIRGMSETRKKQVKKDIMNVLLS